MRVDHQTDLVSEVARLQVSIDRVAAETDMTLPDHPCATEDEDPHWVLSELKELRRQLAALRERVARAHSQNQDDPLALRAELATLLFFAKTLRADADAWRAALADRLKEFERQKAAARQEQQRLASEREELVRRRDALQLKIERTADGMARKTGGECRKTVPVFTLGDGLTVCSMAVSSPGRRFRWAKRWLVTLNDACDEVQVRSE